MELVRLGAPAPLGLPAPAVAIGNFDGVHLGHQALVSAAVADARSSRGTAVVLTFDPHPARVVAPERAPRTLLSLEQRAEILAGLGVDVVAVLPFDRATAALEPDAFVRSTLGSRLAARTVVVGEKFRFGRGRAGDVALLRRMGEGLGFRVHAVAPVLLNGRPVSSSAIREALARGDVAAAAHLLGRAPFADGTVVRGAGRGRRLGVPTANLEVVNETLPRNGVYAGRARLAGLAPLDCVANIGERPTFGGSATTVEAHLLEFAGDLYGRTLRLEFLGRLRDERRFAGQEALLEQIRNDIQAARALLEKAC